jgi:hypothetical protein
MLKKTLKQILNNKNLINKNESGSKTLSLEALSFSFLFVHIPKTAGTSFRKSAEVKYSIIGDYGKDSIHTSESVKEHCYKKQDMYALKRSFNAERNILFGHFLCQKYIDFVDTRHIISFVRDPLEQVVSHYNHSVRYLGYKGSFNDFIVMPKHYNIQSRYLNALPVSLYGFIGSTTNYKESLNFINKRYGLEIDLKQDNVGQEKIQTRDSLTIEQCKKIEINNAKDIVLHNQVKVLFAQQVLYQKNKEVWVHGCGHINPNNLLVGCAYYENSDEAVQLELIINNKLVNQVMSNEFTTLYPKAKLPRSRYVGFHVNLNGFDDVKQVLLQVKETGQSIFEQRL